VNIHYFNNNIDLTPEWMMGKSVESTSTSGVLQVCHKASSEASWSHSITQRETKAHRTSHPLQSSPGHVQANDQHGEEMGISSLAAPLL
jgi:hypothetical protein